MSETHSREDRTHCIITIVDVVWSYEYRQCVQSPSGLDSRLIAYSLLGKLDSAENKQNEAADRHTLCILLEKVTQSCQENLCAQAPVWTGCIISHTGRSNNSLLLFVNSNNSTFILPLAAKAAIITGANPLNSFLWGIVVSAFFKQKIINILQLI